MNLSRERSLSMSLRERAGATRRMVPDNDLVPNTANSKTFTHDFHFVTYRVAQRTFFLFCTKKHFSPNAHDLAFMHLFLKMVLPYVMTDAEDHGAIGAEIVDISVRRTLMTMWRATVYLYKGVLERSRGSVPDVPAPFHVFLLRCPISRQLQQRVLPASLELASAELLDAGRASAERSLKSNAVPEPTFHQAACTTMVQKASASITRDFCTTTAARSSPHFVVNSTMVAVSREALLRIAAHVFGRGYSSKSDTLLGTIRHRLGRV